MFKTSNKLNSLLNPHDVYEVLDTLDGVCLDSTCTTGYDNDGSTGFEIFSNGVSLGASAKGRDIYVYNDDGVALFFITDNEDDLLEKVRKAVEEAFDD